jgi:colanic acid/amylovoran biosynthesis glycosyltransferase
MVARMQTGDTLLLSLPVPLHRRDGLLCLEDQACNGLRLWAGHFARLIVLIPESHAPAPPAWVSLDRIGPALERIELVTLPEAWRPDRFLRALPRALPRIRDAIGRADRMGFAIGGLMGDWGSVAAWAAHRAGKPFYIWTDRVESEVIRRTLPSLPWRRRLKARLELPLMRWNERALIRRAALGLFHGRETYDTYAPYSRNAHLVHDIHLSRADRIAPTALAAKMARGPRELLGIVYAGRAEAMKGGQDWIATLERLAAAGVAFRATWLGDGPERAGMAARVAAGPLAGRVDLPGFVADRGALLTALRAADVLMFCHLTPESPRILIEALVSGTPIVGYGSAFPADLIAGHGGGVLVPVGDTGALAGAVAALDADRARLGDLVARAARDGEGFDDERVFAHRSELIRRHLPPAR